MLHATPFELFQAQLGLILLIGLIASIITFFSWKKGFFHFDKPPVSPKTSLPFIYLCLGFIIYIAVTMLAAPLALQFISSLIGAPFSLSSSIALLSWGNLLILFITASLIYLCIPKRVFASLAKWDFSTKWPKDLLYGILSWIIVFPLVLFTGELLDLLTYLSFQVTQIPQQLAVEFLKATFGHPFYFSLALISIVILAPFTEELLFRGLLQTSIKKYFGRKVAILITALIFAGFHYAPAQGVGNIPIVGSLFVLACFLGFIYEKKGALLAPMALHATFNAISTLNLVWQKAMIPVLKKGIFFCAFLLLFPGCGMVKTRLAQTKPQEKEEVLALSKDNTAFAFSLFEELDSESNLLLSPFSISSCLSMVYLGSAGETESAMKKTLHLTLSEDLVAPIYKHLFQSLSSIEKPNALFMANALWVDNHFSINPSYNKLLNENFSTELKQGNFAKPLEMTKKINAWIAEKTEDKISNLLDPGDINAATRLVIANAIYFKGDWLYPFQEKKTTEESFYSYGDEQKTPLMQQTHLFPYYESEEFQAAFLPFKNQKQGEEIGLFILLPKTSLDEVKSSLFSNPENFLPIIERLTNTSLNIQLPKWKLQYRFDLYSPLVYLGMEQAFSPRANFSKMGQGQKDLFLSKVLHEAFFAIDEKGVEAAGATAAAISLTAARPSENTIPFIANHPFLYFLLDRKTKSILFMGQYIVPKQEKL